MELDQEDELSFAMLGDPEELFDRVETGASG